MKTNKETMCKKEKDTDAVVTHRELIQRQINENQSREDIDDAFYIGDLGDIEAKYQRWRELLPTVDPYYAVKCNSELPVLRLLSKMGVGFDCASKLEIQTILNLGDVDSKKIIYANPCKQKSHLRYAAKQNLQFMTFDNLSELEKIKEVCPEEKLVIRILTDDSTAQCQLGLKFGCHPLRAPSLLREAKDLNLDVIGVSFHVGSGCRDAKSYEKAICNSRCIVDHGTELGFNMKLLDIGGGFPGQINAKISFETVANVINESIKMYFGDEDVKVIAEPGRYFVASAFTLAVNITAKRIVARDCQTFNVKKDLIANSQAPTKSEEPACMYYVNDGVYGSFNCVLYDHATVIPKVLQERGADDEKEDMSSSIWGPSCDGLDRIIECVRLPVLKVGEWIYFEDMGAYTMSAGSEFNGYKKPICFYIPPKETIINFSFPSMDSNNSPSSFHVIEVGTRNEVSRGTCIIDPILLSQNPLHSKEINVGV